MRKALSELPREYAERLSNVEFAVARAPSRRDRKRRDLGNATLYGLYEGVSLIHRDSAYDRVMPDRITLFWGPLVRDFPDDGTLEEQVKITVLHEIAHYFGLDDEDLLDTRVH